MNGITVPGYFLLFGFAIIGVITLVEWHKNRKGKWTGNVFLRKYDKGIPNSYFYRTHK